MRFREGHYYDFDGILLDSFFAVFFVTKQELQ